MEGTELIDGRRNFNPLVQNRLLSLDTNVSRPFDKSCQITFRLDVLTDSEVTRSFLDQRIDFLFLLLNNSLLLRFFFTNSFGQRSYFLAPDDFFDLSVDNV